MSAPDAKLTLCPASTLMLPVLLTMSALTVMSPAAFRVWISTLPLPLALTAVPAVPAPSLRVIEPVADTSTMLPSSLVIKSDWLALWVGVTVSATRDTVTETVPTVTSLLSAMYMPPLPALAANVVTLVSIWFPVAPTPLEMPAFNNKPLALISTSLSLPPLTLSPSMMLPAEAVILTLPKLLPLPAVIVSSVMLPEVASKRILPLLLVVVTVVTSRASDCAMVMAPPAIIPMVFALT